MPDLNLFQEWQNRRQEELAAEVTLTNATAAREAAEALLTATMPEGESFAATSDHPPTYQNVGGRIKIVRAPFLGDPYPATA